MFSKFGVRSFYTKKWLNKVCIDQRNCISNLQCLPIFLADMVTVWGTSHEHGRLVSPNDFEELAKAGGIKLTRKDDMPVVMRLVREVYD